MKVAVTGNIPMFVLRDIESGEFATFPGVRRDYTPNLEEARCFPTLDAATADKCGNEEVARVLDVLREIHAKPR